MFPYWELGQALPGYGIKNPAGGDARAGFGGRNFLTTNEHL